MRWGLVIACSALGGCGFTHGSVPPDAAVDAAPMSFHVRVEAHVDGRSNLIVQGATARWEHFQYAAPGREKFVNYPTRFDGVGWFPIWPDIPDAENRDCGCSSSTYSALAGSVPRAPSQVVLGPVAFRRMPTVLQAPSATNDYTLVIELSDVGFSGASWYTLDVDVVVD